MTSVLDGRWDNDEHICLDSTISSGKKDANQDFYGVLAAIVADLFGKESMIFVVKVGRLSGTHDITMVYLPCERHKVDNENIYQTRKWFP